ncbi:alpha/beta hydrolase family protein [Spirosoma areae]
MDYVLTHSGRVQAVILNSRNYPPVDTKRVDAEVRAPILVLHGTADSPADGGSTVTAIDMARQFEAALRTANKPVDVKYYDGSGHNGIFSDSAQVNDTVHRIAQFVRNRVVR